jgi:hypothetical protein
MASVGVGFYQRDKKLVRVCLDRSRREPGSPAVAFARARAPCDGGEVVALLPAPRAALRLAPLIVL